MTRLVTNLNDQQKTAYRDEVLGRLRLADAVMASYRTERANLEPSLEAEIAREVRQGILAGLSFIPEELAQRARVANTPQSPSWLVTVEGPKGADTRLRPHGFRFENGRFIAGYQNASKANEAAKIARAIDTRWNVTIDPPAKEAATNG